LTYFKRIAGGKTRGWIRSSRAVFLGYRISDAKAWYNSFRFQRTICHLLGIQFVLYHDATIAIVEFLDSMVQNFSKIIL